MRRGSPGSSVAWTDPQRSQKMLPLVKTDTGWIVLQRGYARNDENTYYEDKFATIWNISSTERLPRSTVIRCLNVMVGHVRPGMDS